MIILYFLKGIHKKGSLFTDKYASSYLSTLTEEMFPPDKSAIPEELSPTVLQLTSLAHDTVQQV